MQEQQKTIWKLRKIKIRNKRRRKQEQKDQNLQFVSRLQDNYIQND